MMMTATDSEDNDVDDGSGVDDDDDCVGDDDDDLYPMRVLFICEGNIVGGT